MHMRATVFTSATLLLHAARTVAQFPPTPENVTVLESKFGDGVAISYKEVHEL